MPGNWVAAIYVLVVSVIFAMAGFFYKPPAAAQLEMISAVISKPAVVLHIQGEASGALLSVDFIERENDGSFLRISYPPLKLINNQWIALNSSASPRKTPLSYFRLTSRLPWIKQDGQWFDRYAFVFSDEALNLLPGFESAQGELWFPYTVSWLGHPQTMLPIRGKLTVQSGGSTVAQADLAITYADAFDAEKQKPRVLSDVIAQLNEVAQADNGKPAKLLSISESAVADDEFASDFDRDGLTDLLELFYGTDPENPDSDNDTFLDGEEVEQGYNPRGVGSLN